MKRVGPVPALAWRAAFCGLACVLVLGSTGCSGKPEASIVIAGVVGDPVRGRTALAQHACRACHVIPGMTGSVVYVGPPLDDVADRKYLAGRLPNTPDNLVTWIRDPKRVDPLTAMPDMGVNQQDATDMAAYLLSLR